MAAANAPRRYPCTFAGCKQWFFSHGERAIHKDIEHDYCLRCDIDFPNFEAFLKHKIESDEHIVCPFCSMEFESDEGRDVHIRRTHPVDQQIKCPWKHCNKEFKSASAYINHIEKGRCASGLNKQTLLVQRDIKNLEADTARRLKLEAPPAAGDSSEPTTPTGEDTGGVPITQYDERRQALIHQPRVTDTAASHSWKYWPSLSSASESDNHKQTSSKDPTKTFGATKTATAIIQPSRAPLRIPGSRILQLYRTYSPRFDVNQYINSYTSKYECCHQGFDTPEELAGHLVSHRSERFICPVCKKAMRTVSALVSHAESSGKCNIPNRRDAPALMERVTGGFVEAEFVDDSRANIKYHAATRF